MSNHAECVLVVKKDTAKLAPFITEVNDKGEKDAMSNGYLVKETYVEGDEIEKFFTGKDGEKLAYKDHDLPKEWNAIRDNIKVDYNVIVDYAQKTDGSLRIFYTSDIQQGKINGEDIVVVSFDSAWDFPRPILEWLNDHEAEYQVACVENGCDVRYTKGNSDFGLYIKKSDDEDDSGWYYVEYTDELARAVGNIG